MTFAQLNVEQVCQSVDPIVRDRAPRQFKPGNPNRTGRLGTVDLLALITFDQLLCYRQHFLITKRYLSEKVSCTEPSPSVRYPWFKGDRKPLAVYSMGIKKHVFNYCLNWVGHFENR
jgi:hypothetical protein